MTTRIRHLVASALYWRGRTSAVVSVVLIAVFVTLAGARLTPLAQVYGNNRGVAWGILAAASVAEAYVVLRLARYAWRRAVAPLAPGAPGWTTALIDAARYAAISALTALLLLVPVVGRARQPLWQLGYGESGAWFAAGVVAMAAALALVWPAWGPVGRPRRLLPYVPPRPDLGP